MTLKKIENKASPIGGTAGVYGVPHLLRLFTRLPSLLQTFSMTSSELKKLTMKVNDLIKFVGQMDASDMGFKYRLATKLEWTQQEKKKEEDRLLKEQEAAKEAAKEAPNEAKEERDITDITTAMNTN